MIQHLSVENYALIRKLELPLDKGFTAITGETGAGKSILLGALSLILGNRADTSALYDPDKKCVVEGTFHIDELGLQGFFEANDLDYDKELIMRREINNSGKSRAFINDTPVKLQVMKELGSRLVDIHSQNKTQTLNNADVQLAVVDTVVNNIELIASYRKEFDELKSLERKYNSLVEKERQSKSDIDYYQFLFDELDKASLSEGEQQEAEEELEIQNHAEGIKSALLKGSFSLSEDENSVTGQLKQIYSESEKASTHHHKLKELTDRLNSVLIELEDIASEMQYLSEEINYNPERIEELNSRLSLLYELQQKHHVHSVEELLTKKQELQQQLSNVEDMGEQLRKLAREIENRKEKLFSKAGQISVLRKKVIPRIEKEVTGVLKQLGMPDARFIAEHITDDQLTTDGIDKIQFRFSANKGVEPQPIDKVASGGELSRLMLSVKSLIAKKTFLPTIIFDEIDSGVSGDIAGKTGTIMKKMSQTIQVVAITHLPQIAGKSDTHLFTYKEVKQGKTFSRIKKLEPSERVEELAKMLSDNRITEASLNTAKELMK